MLHLYFDTETTGLPFRPAPFARYGRTHNSNGYPRLIQIGWILTDGNDNVLSRECFIVKPEGFVIPEDAVAVNGITTEEALEKGSPLLDILHRFSEDLSRADVIIGHNIGYDIEVMTGEFRRKNQRNALVRLTSLPVVDTMKSTVEFCAIPFPPDKPRHYDTGCDYKYPKLRELHQILFGCGFENAHDAMADIEATRKCFVELERKGICFSRLNEQK